MKPPTLASQSPGPLVPAKLEFKVTAHFSSYPFKISFFALPKSLVYCGHKNMFDIQLILCLFPSASPESWTGLWCWKRVCYPPAPAASCRASAPLPVAVSLEALQLHEVILQQLLPACQPVLLVSQLAQWLPHVVRVSLVLLFRKKPSDYRESSYCQKVDSKGRLREKTLKFF